MKYNINNLPDFFSVRNLEQIDYSLEGMEGKRCYCFFDNGFQSSIIEPNKRDIRFIWDGFILFTDIDITIENMMHGADLYNGRLVAFQRIGQKLSNDSDIRNYVLGKLEEKNIPYEIMEDKREVSGYPTKCDLWSTRDSSVLLDAIDCIGEGKAYYFRNEDFRFSITFNKSRIPELFYSHQGAIVLRGENSTAISRLINNDQMLKDSIENIVGSETIYSYMEGRFLPGKSINDIENAIKK